MPFKFFCKSLFLKLALDINLFRFYQFVIVVNKSKKKKLEFFEKKVTFEGVNIYVFSTGYLFILMLSLVKMVKFVYRFCKLDKIL